MKIQTKTIHASGIPARLPEGKEAAPPEKERKRKTTKTPNMSSLIVIQHQMNQRTRIRPPQIPEELFMNSRGCRGERAKPPVPRLRRFNPGWGWPMERARRTGMGQPRRGWINGGIGPGVETPGYSWENHSVVGKTRTILLELNP